MQVVLFTKSDINRMESFFLQAALLGYPTGGTYYKVKDNPFQKRFMFEQGMFKLTDTYWSVPNTYHSAGETLLFMNGEPCWIMQYGGFYLEEALFCLKTSLAFAYEMNAFLGGRGPSSTMHGNYMYTNLPEGNFSRFMGRETIFRMDPAATVGYHAYQGWLLS